MIITFGHVVWLVLGALVSQALQSIWKLLTGAFGLGFKEAVAEQIKLGRAMTHEEKEELNERVKEKLIQKLQNDN